MAHIATTEFLEKYQRLDISGLPKYAQLREALLAAIEDGYWTPGSRMPNEAALASMTPFSLGTVQKAMHDLVQSGVVVRRRGEGTFVATRRGAMNSPLHLRFEDEEGHPLPVYPHISARETVTDDGPWTSFFGAEAAELLRVDRVFWVGKIFFVFSRIYLNAARFPLFASRPASKLDAANFKDVMHHEYNVRVQRIRQFLHNEKFSAKMCDILRVSKGTRGSRLELYAVGMGDRPVYYQEAFIPPNPCRLHLSDWMQGL